jgi:hypothetical protein
MFSQDYILRMINQVIAVLSQIAGLRKAGQYQQAQQAVDQAYEQLLGLRADLLRQMDDATLLRMLTQQDQLDTVRSGLLADLFKAEGDLLADQGQLQDSRKSNLRALTFYLETGLTPDPPEPDPALHGKVIALVQTLGLANLPEEALWALFCYAEAERDYIQAEAAIHQMMVKPDLRAELQPELVAFYQRLAALEPSELARVGLDHPAILEKLKQARRQGRTRLER